jgi:hypothetical protein
MEPVSNAQGHHSGGNSDEHRHEEGRATSGTHNIHVSVDFLESELEAQKFKLPENASLLEVMQVGARLASVTLLPNGENPLDRLHAILKHGEIGPPIEDLRQALGNFIHDRDGKHNFGIELVRAFRVNTRWAVAPQPEMTPHQILALLGLNFQEYTLYQPGSVTPLPLDTAIPVERGTVFEAQRDGKYGQGR